MSRLTVASGVAVVATALLAGCGSGGARTPSLSGLPLVAGAQVVAQEKACDPGAAAYCALQLVVVDPQYHTSTDLVAGEHRLLLAHKWSGATGDTAAQKAADSPGHKLRVTYATAADDLTGSEFKFIQRTHSIDVALSHTMFARQSAMSVMLEIGTG
jgi:hypothetical protein